MTQTANLKPLGYLDYRCPICQGCRCGNDANAGWDVVTQQSTLLSEFDDQWCNDCGEVTLEEFTVTDPVEIARINTERARLRMMAAAQQLYAVARAAFRLLSGPEGLLLDDPKNVRTRLLDAILLARFGGQP